MTKNPPAPASRPVRRFADLDAKAWKGLLISSADSFNRAGLFATARGIAFSWMLALVPCLAAFVSLYGMFADTTTALHHLSILRGVLPGRAISLIGDEMIRIAAEEHRNLGAAFAFSLIVAFWSAATGIKALLRGLNIAYSKPETRSFLALSTIALCLTLAAFTLAVLLAGALVALPFWAALFPNWESWALLELVRWPVLFLLVTAACETLYRFGPSRPLGRWRSISVGSAAAAAIWLLGSAVLAWSLSTFDAFAVTYGSLAAVFAVMFWSWLSATAILAGAKLNAEIDQRLDPESGVTSN